jgi:hypothetical protein
LKSKEFIKAISIDGNDRLRIRIATEKGQVANIMVQYEANIAGVWREIVRYDCAHGFLHRDVILINRDRNLFYFNRVPAPLLLPIK